MFDEALSLAAVDSLYNANVVPEPTTMGLLLCGLLSLAGLRTARRKS
ncbi:MAG: PEP-CTERM sorting domain-containing protein [Planctomycetota bacterium]|nr:PEP-CTERM sorting domain-containing protein [Planctomycetota bacterium]